MSPRLARPLVALALAGGACLLAAAPALAGPKHAAEAALASLDGQAHRAVVTSTFRAFLRGAGKLGQQFPSIASRTVVVHAVESARREVLTFTAAPDQLRGVRVVTYDGQVYLSRQGGPFQRAAGQLKRFLATAAPNGPDTSGIVGAEVLSPVTRNGVQLRHLRVRFGAAEQIAAARRAMVQQGLPPAIARRLFSAYRIDSSVADIYVDAGTGLLAESTTRLAMRADMRAVARAIGAPEDDARGVMVFRASTSLRVTGVGAVAVERPASVGTVSSPEYLGLPGSPPAARGPVGDAEGIVLARRVNAAYRRVPGLVMTTRQGPDTQEVTLALAGGRDRAAHIVVTSGGKRSEWIGLSRAGFSREAGAACWTKGDPDTSSQPAINLNGSRFYAPRASGAVVRLRVLEQIPGAEDTGYFVYTIDRRSGRVIAQTAGGVTSRWRALARAPRIAAPTALCATV
jgi:hypothetical protein